MTQCQKHHLKEGELVLSYRGIKECLLCKTGDYCQGYVLLLSGVRVTAVSFSVVSAEPSRLELATAEVLIISWWHLVGHCNAFSEASTDELLLRV